MSPEDVAEEARDTLQEWLDGSYRDSRRFSLMSESPEGDVYRAEVRYGEHEPDRFFRVRCVAEEVPPT